MTRGEAERKLKNHKKESLGFCPLIKDNCRMDCVCFVKAEIWKPSSLSDTYFFSEHHCISHMLNGGEE